MMSPDANGDGVQARLIAEAGRPSFSPDSPVLDVGMHGREATDGLLHGGCAAGLPTIFAAAGNLAGLGPAGG